MNLAVRNFFSFFLKKKTILHNGTSQKIKEINQEAQSPQEERFHQEEEEIDQEAEEALNCIMFG